MPRWRVFLSSMLVTLFCLAPLYLLFIGGTLFGVQSAGTAAEGVSTLTPNAQDSLTLLLVVEEPSPSAALVSAAPLPMYPTPPCGMTAHVSPHV